jgi:hypothetical protein
LVFKNRHCVLLADGTHVLKHAGEAYLMFVLIKKVRLVSIRMVYADIKNARNGQVYNTLFSVIN